MPKDQRTKWREAKQRYRDKLRSGQPTNQESEESDDSGDFWTG